MTADVIPPGGEGEIQVTLSPKAGQLVIDKKVLVHSNDPDQPTFGLTMKGSILVDMSAHPANVSLREIEVGKPATAPFTLTPSPGSSVKVLSVEIEDTEHFTLKKLQTNADGSETYEVGYRGSDKPGHATTRVIVKTDGENTPELMLSVNANVVTNLRYVDRIRFAQKDGVLQERIFRISSRKGDAPKIKKIEDPDGWLEIEQLENEGPMVNIRLRVKPEKVEGLDTTARTAPHTLIIHTNDKQMPRIEVEYRVAPPPREFGNKAQLSPDAAAKLPATATATDAAAH